MNPKWKVVEETILQEWVVCEGCNNTWLLGHIEECGCEEE